MIHIKRGVIAHSHHKKIILKAKGYYGARSRVYRVAKQAVIKSHQYAYRDRKQKKRYFRSLWITRINALSRKYNINYNKLIYGMKKSFIKLNRKILSDIAITDPYTFYLIIKKVKKALNIC